MIPIGMIVIVRQKLTNAGAYWVPYMDEWVGQMAKVSAWDPNYRSYFCDAYRWKPKDLHCGWRFPEKSLEVLSSALNTICPYCRAKAHMTPDYLYCSAGCPASRAESKLPKIQ